MPVQKPSFLDRASAERLILVGDGVARIKRPVGFGRVGDVFWGGKWYVSVASAARMTGYDRSTLRRWINMGFQSEEDVKKSVAGLWGRSRSH